MDIGEDNIHPQSMELDIYGDDGDDNHDQN